VLAVPTLAEHACLTLVVQGVSHGWAIGSLLTPDGELGRVFTLSRPLTYRAIDGLVAQGLVRRKEPTGGTRDRATLTATAAGRRAAATWLDSPVDHVRDVRVELMVKLLLRERAGLPRADLARAQLAALPFDRLLSGGDDDLVDLWRREHARSVQAFLHALTERETRG
jgi:PadR family transcriptional regulator AphA